MATCAARESGKHGLPKQSGFLLPLYDHGRKRGRFWWMTGVSIKTGFFREAIYWGEIVFCFSLCVFDG